jgi:hypothetical protein
VTSNRICPYPRSGAALDAAAPITSIALLRNKCKSEIQSPNREWQLTGNSAAVLPTSPIRAQKYWTSPLTRATVRGMKTPKVIVFPLRRPPVNRFSQWPNDFRIDPPRAIPPLRTTKHSFAEQCHRDAETAQASGRQPMISKSCFFRSDVGSKAQPSANQR